MLYEVITALIPFTESNNGLVNDSFPFNGFSLAIFDIFINDAFQVINVVNISVGQTVDFRINIPGNCNINKKQRPIFALANDAFDLIAVYHKIRCAG